MTRGWAIFSHQTHLPWSFHRGLARDGLCRELAPRDPRTVRVAPRVVRRWTRDVVAGQSFGDGVDAATRDELGEDPDKLVQALAIGSLGGVRMRSRANDHVAVRRTPTRKRPSSLACALIAALTRFRFPLLMPPNTDTTRSCASFLGSIGPPLQALRAIFPFYVPGC
jgi:hypothetical protein